MSASLQEFWLVTSYRDYSDGHGKFRSTHWFPSEREADDWAAYLKKMGSESIAIRKYVPSPESSREPGSRDSEQRKENHMIAGNNILKVWSPEMTIEEYHAEREHDSNSTLRMFDASPGKYYHTRHTGRIVDKATDPQRLGTLAHLAILEPHLLDGKVAIPPAEVLAKNGARSTNDYRDWAAERSDKLIVTQEELDNARWQSESCWANPPVKEYLARNTLREQSIFWITQFDKLKTRIDSADEIAAEVVDVKKSTNTAEEFHYKVADFGYLGQGALQQDGYEAYFGHRPRFGFLLVGDKPPFDNCLRWVPDAALSLGRAMNAETLFKLRECKQGRRPWIRDGYDKVEDLYLPPRLLPSEPSEVMGVRHEY